MDGIKDIFNDNAKLKQGLSINDIVANDPFYIDKTADWLQEKLRPTVNSRDFYCKAAQYITKNELENHLVKCLEKGRNPAKLFNYIVSRRLIQLGVDINVKKRPKR